MVALRAAGGTVVLVHVTPSVDGKVFVEDAMAARGPEEHANTVRTLFPRIGRVRSTAEVLAALEAATTQV